MEDLIVYALLLWGCWVASGALFVEEEVLGE